MANAPPVVFSIGVYHARGNVPTAQFRHAKRSRTDCNNSNDGNDGGDGAPPAARRRRADRATLFPGRRWRRAGRRALALVRKPCRPPWPPWWWRRSASSRKRRARSATPSRSPPCPTTSCAPRGPDQRCAPCPASACCSASLRRPRPGHARRPSRPPACGCSSGCAAVANAPGRGPPRAHRHQARARAAPPLAPLPTNTAPPAPPAPPARHHRRRHRCALPAHRRAFAAPACTFNLGGSMCRSAIAKPANPASQRRMLLPCRLARALRSVRKNVPYFRQF